MTYDEQLKDERWLSLRHVIMCRDLHMCTKCGKKKNLQVHHKQYRPGKMAWEYDPSDLTTLCRLCHMAEHKIDTGEYLYFSPCARSKQIKTIAMVMREFIQQVAQNVKRDGK